KNLLILIFQQRLEMAYRMHCVSEIMESYEFYINMLIENRHYHLIDNMKFLHLSFEAIYQSESYVEKQLDSMTTIEKDEKDFIKSISFFHHQRYEDVIEHYLKSEFVTPDWLSIYLMSLDQLNDSKNIVKCLQCDETMKTLSTSSNYQLIRHFKYKYLSDKNQLLSYLRRDILGVKHLSDDFIILEYLVHDARKLFSKYQYYKEAVQVTHQYLPKLKQLNRNPKSINTN
ncbi:MAG: hypothetical protein IH571_01680, partial [Acholeplasmataceae bacterium]|nr:hypothetical protein [Acholeplasmataceae bacterium]